jgi:hypothetical protein
MKRNAILFLIVILISSCSMLSIESTASEANPSSRLQTETITNHPIETFTPTKTLMPSPTKDESWQTVFSPNGKLIAKAYEGYWRSFIPQVIEVQDLEGDVIWAVPFQGELPRSDPHSTMRIIGWAPDSSTLYFYYSWAYDGGYTVFDGHWLQSLDIETGVTNYLITKGIIAFSFNSDMSKIGYTSAGRIGIYDIASGDDRNVPIRSDSIEQSGQIHWSPSSDGLVFTVLLDDGFFSREIYMDARSMSQTVIFETCFECYSFDDWTQNEGLRYVAKLDFEDQMFGPQDVVIIDTDTFDFLVLGTPTPRP